jgi:hypothetical protein
LLRRNLKKLSKEYGYIKGYRPEMFLGALQYHWKSYSNRDKGFASGIISDTEVLCEGHWEVVLKKTYLPIPRLKNIRAQFLATDERFPFLHLPEPLKEGSYQEWGFLGGFGVKMSEDLGFYLSMLDSILDSNKLASGISDFLRIFRLYEAIQSQCWGSGERENQAETVLLVFAPKFSFNELTVSKQILFGESCNLCT